MAVQTPAEMEADSKKALTAFVMDNDELVKLEALLGRFNIFRVLRAAHHEIRHSNMLAWLFDPEETHGLGDRFLRRWLMEVVHDAAGTGGHFNNLPSPIEVDVLDIEYVEVARERANIDLLLLIKTGKGRTWVVCIENKVRSVQGKQQLEGYRKFVQGKYSDAERKLFVFLTKNDEDPNDPEWVSSTYNTIEGVLRRCLEERGKTIGHEPHLLMTQYLNLLAEDFVEDSESTELARKIYQRHKKAIDFIFESRTDGISAASDTIRGLLERHSLDLGIIMAPCNKRWIRFLPRAWDVPQNAGGTAWGTNSRYVLCVVGIEPKGVELRIVVGRAPEQWAHLVLESAGTSPFNHDRKRRPGQRIKLFQVSSSIDVEGLEDADGERIGEKIFEWVREEMTKPKFKEAVVVVGDLLKKLGKS